MQVKVYKKLNDKSADHIMFDAEVSIVDRGKEKVYCAEADLSVFDIDKEKNVRVKKGEGIYVGYGKLIDEAVGELIRNMPFYRSM